ncbi:SYCE3 protein, partial [Urocolius indicus]|nr:SYCE3 protein [Urocolius indicus]
MAESEPQEGNCDDMVKIIEDLNRDLEKLLDEVEKLTVQTISMTYDMVVLCTNPDLTNSISHLTEVFQSCKEEIEKKWQDMPTE